jgi:hypothetical protein
MKRQRDNEEEKESKEEKQEKKQRKDDEEKKQKEIVKKREEKEKKEQENIIKILVGNYFDKSVKLDKSLRFLHSSDVKSLKLISTNLKKSLDKKIAILEYRSKIVSIYGYTWQSHQESLPWKQKWFDEIEKWLHSIKLNIILPDEYDDITRYFLTLGPNVRMTITVEEDDFSKFEIYSLLNPKSRIRKRKNIKRKDEVNKSTSHYHLKCILFYWYKELFPETDLFSKDILYNSNVPPFNMWVKYVVELLNLFSTYEFDFLGLACDNPTPEEIKMVQDYGISDFSASNVIWVSVFPLSSSSSASLATHTLDFPLKTLGDSRICYTPSWVRLSNIEGLEKSWKLSCGTIIYSESVMNTINSRILEKIVLNIFLDKEINTRKFDIDIDAKTSFIRRSDSEMRNYSWRFADFVFSSNIRKPSTVELSISKNGILFYRESICGEHKSLFNDASTLNDQGKLYSLEQIISLAKWILLTTLEIDIIFGETRENKETKASFEKDYLMNHTSIGRSTLREKQVENSLFSQLPKDVGKMILNNYVESFHTDQPPTKFLKVCRNFLKFGLKN